MSTIRDHVMVQPLFCSHDHHRTLAEFDAHRDSYDHTSLLGYAVDDLATVAGAALPPGPPDAATLARLWPRIRFTGFGRAVTLGCRALFDLEYEPANFAAVAEALQAAIRGRAAAEIYEEFVHDHAGHVWTIHDSGLPVLDAALFDPANLPPRYRSVFRADPLYDMVDTRLIGVLEIFTGCAIYTLDDLVTAVNAAIARVRDQGRLAGIKIAMGLSRDLIVTDPTRHEAERAFCAIRGRVSARDGRQQYNGTVDVAAGRPLGDYLFHVIMGRAHDEDLPVQIHTGYTAGVWGPLAGVRPMSLLPVIEKYRAVRFDLFHASWPWTSEAAAIAKSYPNVWLDMCWAWALDPTASERALDDWLDAVPYTKILAFGADTHLPWCNVGYALQARQGIANVLERKVARGDLSVSAACEVADRLMLENGAALFRLDPAGAGD